jgi:hypothetical protein
MGEIVGGLLAGISGIIAKLYPAWIFADFIMGGLSLLYVAITGELAGLLGEVAINAAIGAIPFPFNLLAIFYISPVYLVLQIIVFAILFVAFFRDD